MNFNGIYEKTVVIVKPDGVQRGLIGEVIGRLERKGIKIVGFKLANLTEAQLREHYSHHVEKPFYPGLQAFMMSSPVAVICAEGKNVVEAVRIMAGATNGSKADAGTLRGELAMGMCNVVHCSDSVDNGEAEVKRFFAENEIFDYNKTEYLNVYMEDERA
ncbi:MAG: nucleoside-diphosphate kinase [Candidatus Magasanikbacteria bacterium RIFCSPHIGHO2_02_FULL_41_13]|uniref:Nucleoside diphosphate kinase n=1 Tax=Candidatus Magasanikbacteria bacterium RIFCSPHIGHO2_02_FULL_41_13 TaxID=1798676 RepID=A0A1F6M4T5_9BACT|nr:MAG: nucleoside-diphosphate kinase [Candidatus Magasanikbacteria bacterium RIFCSPHIGHO2_02_FULL_41_13]